MSAGMVCGGGRRSERSRRFRAWSAPVAALFVLAALVAPAALAATAGSGGIPGTVGSAATSPPAGSADPAAADPSAPTVAARIDHEVAHVGDPLTLTITAVSRRGTPVNLPNVVELGPFTLLSRSESEIRGVVIP